MASRLDAVNIEIHAGGSEPPFLRAAAKVVSSDEPRTTREELYREAPPSLPFIITNLPPPPRLKWFWVRCHTVPERLHIALIDNRRSSVHEGRHWGGGRSEEHTSELQSRFGIS